MAYFTLVCLDDWNKWGVEFGDYDREVVSDERDDAIGESSMGVPRYNSMRRFKILRHADARQATIDADVARLNAEWKN